MTSNTSSRSGSSMNTARPGKPTGAAGKVASPRKNGAPRPAPYPKKLKAIETQIPAGKTPTRMRDTKARKSDKGLSEKSAETEVVLPVEDSTPEEVMVAEITPFNAAPMLGQLVISLSIIAADVSSAGPSKSRSPPMPLTPKADQSTSFTSLHDRLQRLELQNASLTNALDAKERKWQDSLSAAEERWQARVAAERIEWERRVAKLEDSLQNMAGPSKPRVVSFADEQVVLGKRGTDASSTSSRRSTFDHLSKRPRVESDPPVRTPSPIIPSVSTLPPQTPPPSHQGIPPDMSQTPVVDPEFFAHGPIPRSGRKSSQQVDSLPYPIFATTPKPSEPRSPTTDGPPSASRNRTAVPNKGVLTPGRKRSADAEPVSTSRAVSNAHKELSTITEETNDAGPSHRRQGSGTPGPLLGPALQSTDRGERKLSASPSIPGDRDGFSYTPFPPVPRSALRGSPTPNRPRTPPRQRHRGQASSSPSREYMEIAMHGLESAPRNTSGQTDQSPSAFATPGHRTMLGTETYRDTRFGDVPVMSWGTPSVDLGSGMTPRTSLGRAP